MHERIVFKKLLLGICCFFFICSASNAKEDSALLVRVAVLKNFPPHYTTTENGTPGGFGVDVMEGVAKIANLHVEYIVKENWEEVWDALADGEVDLVPDQGITPVRKKRFDYTMPIEVSPISIFVRQESEQVQTLDGLAGKRVGVVHLNVGEAMVADKPKIQAKVFSHPEDALINLLTGNVDAIIFPEHVLRKLARDARVADRIKVAGKPVREIRRAMAVARGNTALLERLNPALKSFLQSGEYTQIYIKWYGKAEPFWSVRRVMAVMLAAIVLMVALMSYWRYRTMSRLNIELKSQIIRREDAEEKLKASYELLEQKVDERTRDLQNALSEVKTLSGLLPICSHCKKIRDDNGYWNQIESYIRQHSDAEFSHSICQECAEAYFPELHLYENLDQLDPDKKK